MIAQLNNNKIVKIYSVKDDKYIINYVINNYIIYADFELHNYFMEKIKVSSSRLDNYLFKRIKIKMKDEYKIKNFCKIGCKLEKI